MKDSLIKFMIDVIELNPGDDNADRAKELIIRCYKSYPKQRFIAIFQDDTDRANCVFQGEGASVRYKGKFAALLYMVGDWDHCGPRTFYNRLDTVPYDGRPNVQSLFNDVVKKLETMCQGRVDGLVVACYRYPSSIETWTCCASYYYKKAGGYACQVSLP